ncbi:MAG: putative manganese-dependent inorganic diphosphatase, partial [Erysipelotrichaceae bacterium]
MKQKVYIMGHRNPDSDSICSSIAYSYLKQQLGLNAMAVKLGPINTETKYILERFKFETPATIYNIKPKIRDIDFDDPILILKNEPIKEVYKKLLVNNKAVAAVVEDCGELIGVVSLSDITNALLSLTRQEYTLLSKASFENVVKSVEGKVVFKAEKYNFNGKVSIASSVLGELTAAEFENKIAITSTRKSTQINAILAKVTMVISTSSDGFDAEVIALARQHEVSLISTKADLIAVASNIASAISCVDIMTNKKIETFSLYDYVDDVKERINKSRHRAYPVIDRENRIMGFISRYHVLNARKKKIILLDHQEINQSIEGVKDADVLEIIDHHKLGDLKTNAPVYFRNEICGATATIIAGLFEEYQVEIPTNYASLLLSAIISDTMNFHSPTTK